MPDGEDLPDADALEAAVNQAAAPYAAIDATTLPIWWQSAIDEFEAAGLHSYQPARFEDGVIVHTCRESLEERYDVTIDFFGRNVHPGDQWQIRVDGKPVGGVGHRRTVAGYTVFEMRAEALESTVESAVGDQE